ncbi:unnamed protein product [Blepharisma stoltei]|uniref:Uncharacterized protein n=1 Tax=Blepharisma stoltei TaxID=1481888 RepID=A0AAU9INM4_9CILI|nr:unnamed protein product [Blepharisma stoltei]
MSKVNVYHYPQRSFTPSPTLKSPQKTASYELNRAIPASSETYRSNHIRNSSDGGDLLHYLRQPSENEKILRAETLLKEIYNKEEKVYSPEKSSSKSNSPNRAATQPPFATFQEFKEDPIDINKLYEQVKTKASYQGSKFNNPVSKSYDNGQMIIYSKSLPKSFDPIRGITKNYIIDRTTLRSEFELKNDSSPIRDKQMKRGLFNPITGKSENFTNRSFTYGEGGSSPVKALSSMRFNNVSKTIPKPFASFQNGSRNAGFDSNSIIKLLNGRKVLKGMGYQQSNVF